MGFGDYINPFSKKKRQALEEQAKEMSENEKSQVIV